MDRICVLLPAFNEEGRVERVIAGIRALALEDASVEIVVVDDGSADATVAVSRAAGARVVELGEHRGVGAALARGFALARDEGFDYLVHLDADGQIDPAQIPAVLAPVRRGAADASIGSRFLTGTPEYLAPWKARALKLLAACVGAAVDAPQTDLSCGIRALNAAAIEAARLRVVETPVAAVGRGGPRGLSARTVRYTATYLLLLSFGLARFWLARLTPAPEPLEA